MRSKTINEMEVMPYKIRCYTKNMGGENSTEEIKGAVFNYGGERFGVAYECTDYYVVTELRSGAAVITGNTKESAIKRLKGLPMDKLHERIMKFDDLNPDIKPKVTLRQTKKKGENE